jgi:hypothetical protein
LATVKRTFCFGVWGTSYFGDLQTSITALTERTAKHGEYSHYSVFIMFRHLALHDFLHAYRIEELLLKKDWDK